MVLYPTALFPTALYPTALYPRALYPTALSPAARRLSTPRLVPLGASQLSLLVAVACVLPALRALSLWPATQPDCAARTAAREEESRKPPNILYTICNILEPTFNAIYLNQ